MFYRENGQFKTTYQADQQILPIRQDRLAMLAILVLAFVVVPALADDYFFLFAVHDDVRIGLPFYFLDQDRVLVSICTDGLMVDDMYTDFI